METRPGDDFWEYRVFDAGDEGLWIIEVHVDGITLASSSDLKPAAPLGFATVDDLKGDFDRMLAAFKDPALTAADFPDKGICPDCNSLKYRCNCW